MNSRAGGKRVRVRVRVKVRVWYGYGVDKETHSVGGL